MTSLPRCASDPCCLSNAECASAAICFEGMCAPTCDDVSQCREGQLCHAGVCVAALRSASQCPYEEKRQPARPPQDAGPVLDAGIGDDGGIVEPACEAAFEPNDTLAAASPIGEGVVHAAICPAGDDDYFRVTLPEPGSALTVRLHFAHAEGDLDLEVLNVAGERVAVSQRTGDVEELEVEVAEASALLVHVYGFGRAMNEYTLEVLLSPATQLCEDDALEDNDTLEQATLLVPGDDVTAAFCAGDPDVYRVPLPSGMPVWVMLEYGEDDDLSLEVRDTQLGVLGASASTSGLELVRFVHAGTATDGVSARVSGSNDRPAARSYTVGARFLDETCGLDDYEPNGLPEDAVSLSLTPASQTYQGVVCERDVDIFRLLWPPSAVLVSLELLATGDTRAFALAADDLSLITPISTTGVTSFSPGSTAQSGETLVFVIGGADDSDYELRARALIGE